VVESDLNSIITKAFNNDPEGSWAYKPTDPRGQFAYSSQEIPFDLFAASSEGNFYFWETKLIKHKYSAFSFNSIRDHQYRNLTKLENIFKKFHNVFCIIALGIWIPRKSFDLMFFNIDLINELRNGSKSIKQKDLLAIREKGLYLSIKKQSFDIRAIPSKIIWNREDIYENI
jgi:hypothetical protein